MIESSQLDWLISYLSFSNKVCNGEGTRNADRGSHYSILSAIRSSVAALSIIPGANSIRVCVSMGHVGVANWVNNISFRKIWVYQFIPYIYNAWFYWFFLNGSVKYHARSVMSMFVVSIDSSFVLRPWYSGRWRRIGRVCTNYRMARSQTRSVLTYLDHC